MRLAALPVGAAIKEEPGWAVSSVNYDLKALLARAERI
jgi:hypothetical protein